MRITKINRKEKIKAYFFNCMYIKFILEVSALCYRFRLRLLGDCNKKKLNEKIIVVLIKIISSKKFQKKL